MDARRKKVLIILSVASLILVWRLYVIFTEYLPATSQAGPAPVAVGPVNNQTTSHKDDSMKDIWKAQEKVTELSWGRDPFANVLRVLNLGPDDKEVISSEPPTPPSIQFTGVSMSEDQWLAAWQGNIVRVGDMVKEDFEVVGIDKHSVTLKSDGWLFTYALGSQKPEIRPFTEEP